MRLDLSLSVESEGWRDQLDAIEAWVSGQLGRAPSAVDSPLALLKWKRERPERRCAGIYASDVGFKVSMTDVLDSAEPPRELLSRVPDHTVATVGTPRHSWWLRAPYEPLCSFGVGHYTLGSFCAFRGPEGHARVVSPRWLDHGPFRVFTEGDTTWVQFFDLEADEATAWEQAHPGHVWMADKNRGGFVEKPPAWFVFAPGTYDRGSGTSIVLVHGHDKVTPLHMLEAACAKVLQPFPGITVRQVAFVFFEEVNARKHLHDLWLRGLECRWMSPRGEVRLDEDYHPHTPERPDWVKAVQDREAK